MEQLVAPGTRPGATEANGRANIARTVFLTTPWLAKATIVAGRASTRRTGGDAYRRISPHDNPLVASIGFASTSFWASPAGSPRSTSMGIAHNSKPESVRRR